MRRYGQRKKERTVVAPDRGMGQEGVAMLLVALLAIFALMLDKGISHAPLFDKGNVCVQHTDDKFIASMQ